MRILMISDVYFPRINGVSTSTQTFIREFRKRDHHVTLIAPAYPANHATDHAANHTEGEPDADIQRISSRYLFMDPEDRMMRSREVMRLLPRLREQAFDILHIQTPFVAHYLGVKLAQRLGIPRVETYHTLFEEYLYNYIPWLPRSWLRFAARRFSSRQCNGVDGVVVPSTAMQQTLQRYGVATPTAIIPTGLPMEDFKGCNGARFRERHGIAPGRPTLVHVGRVAHEKNIDFLMHVVKAVRARIPDILFLIAGEGPALSHLKRMSVHLGIQDNVLFVGYLSREGELLDCYCAGDLFVFSSRTETQGLVLLEAMALGVPVVSTAVMGTRDILAPGKGAQVAEENVDDFCEKICTLLADPQRRQAMAEEAREYAETWSAGALAERMLTFYTEIRSAWQTSPDKLTGMETG